MPRSRPYWTDMDKPADVRFSGPLPVILAFADNLHERTPYLVQYFHPGNEEGILIARVDRRRMRTVRTIRYRFHPAISHEDISTSYEVLRKHQIATTFTLRDMTITPYAGPLPSFQAKIAVSDTPTYYRIVDTPDAAIARTLASCFPTYSYQAGNTHLTYIALSSQAALDVLPRLTLAFPGISINTRFALPYETTSPLSPQERRYDAPDYL